MRILIFNWQDIKNPLAGGAEVHLHEVFSRIVKMGHEVTLFCSSFKGAPDEEIINGIRVLRKGGRYLFNFHVPFQYFFRFRNGVYDLIIDDMNKIPFFTPLYLREPLYFITHHMFDKSIFLEVPFPLALYVYLTEKAGFALSRNRKLPFIVGSPSTKAELVAKGFDPAMIEIINYCVDHTIHKRSNIQRSTKPLIGYFGRLKKYKSIEHLLRAVALVMKKIPDLELFIVGEGDNRKALESLTVQLGINQVVRFTGFVNEAEKVRLMQEVWFAVNTSSKEGWGLTVVEANACGTTVLASNVPGLRDAINDGETGLLYEYGNIDELSKKILTLIGDSSLRNRLAQAAHTWALTFDWDQAAQRTMELLQNHVNQSSKMLS